MVGAAVRRRILPRDAGVLLATPGLERCTTTASELQRGGAIRAAVQDAGRSSPRATTLRSDGSDDPRDTWTCPIS